MAVRQHLLALEADGLVESAARPPQGRGRPSVAWRIAEAAAAVFPDAHAELTVGLIGAIREAVGEPGLRRIVEVRARAPKISFSPRHAVTRRVGFLPIVSKTRRACSSRPPLSPG